MSQPPIVVAGPADRKLSFPGVLPTPTSPPPPSYNAATLDDGSATVTAVPIDPRASTSSPERTLHIYRTSNHNPRTATIQEDDKITTPYNIRYHNRGSPMSSAEHDIVVERSGGTVAEVDLTGSFSAGKYVELWLPRQQGVREVGTKGNEDLADVTLRRESRFSWSCGFIYQGRKFTWKHTRSVGRGWPSGGHLKLVEEGKEGVVATLERKSAVKKLGVLVVSERPWVGEWVDVVVASALGVVEQETRRKGNTNRSRGDGGSGDGGSGGCGGGE